MGEKRKNGAPRRFQWGLLVVGFALGVLLTLILVPRGSTASTTIIRGDGVSDVGLWMTATRIVQDATAHAAAPLVQPTQDPALDPILATATAMVAQATQTAQASQ